MIAQRVLDFSILLAVNLGLILVFAVILVVNLTRQLTRIPVKVRIRRTRPHNLS
jgi:hypothetical protein